MRRNAILAALAAATVSLAVLPGCGGDEPPRTRDAATATAAAAAAAETTEAKAEFVREADAVCAQNDEEMAPLLIEWPDPVEADDLPRIAKASGRFLPVLERRLDALAELEPPADDDETVEAIWNRFRTVLNTFERAREAAVARDIDEYHVAQAEGLAALGLANEVARDYGFEVCSRLWRN